MRRAGFNSIIRIIKKELENALEELSEYNPDEIDGVASEVGEEEMELEEDDEEEEE